MVSRKSIMLVLLVACAVALPACARTPASYVADQGRRNEVISILLNDASSRQEVIDRLVGPPAERAAIIDRIVKDEEVAGQLLTKLLSEDRGKAMVASKVAADSGGAKTFIRMLMLTGAMGASLTQQQAEALGLGEPFSFGNQRRTMTDLKKIGTRIENWAKAKGRYPVCRDFGDIDACLKKQIGEETFKDVRVTDAWGRPIQYRTDPDGSQYILVSYATDGQYDELGKVGPTQSYDCDIVFSNGDFIQWPGIIRKSDVR